MARQAVNYAIDRRAMVAARQRLPEADVLLPARGHRRPPDRRRARTATRRAPDLAKAKQLVQQSGMAGHEDHGVGRGAQPAQASTSTTTPTCSTRSASRRRRRSSPTRRTSRRSATRRPNPQTGFADWIQDFPNPSDFYLLLDAHSIQPTNNQNFSKVNDPHIQSELKKLNPVPATKLDTVAEQWQALDEYIAQKAYVAVYGAEQRCRSSSPTG